MHLRIQSGCGGLAQLSARHQHSHSQNHRLAEDRGELWRKSGTNTLLKQRHLQPVSQDGYWISLRQKTLETFWANCASAQSPSQIQSVYWCLEGTSCVLLCIRCSLSTELEHHWKEPDSLFFAPFMQVLTYIDKIPHWTLSSPGWIAVALSAFPYMSSAPVSLPSQWPPLLDYLQYLQVSKHWEAQNWLRAHSFPFALEWGEKRNKARKLMDQDKVKQKMYARAKNNKKALFTASH